MRSAALLRGVGLAMIGALIGTGIPAVAGAPAMSAVASVEPVEPAASPTPEPTASPTAQASSPGPSAAPVSTPTPTPTPTEPPTPAPTPSSTPAPTPSASDAPEEHVEDAHESDGPTMALTRERPVMARLVVQYGPQPVFRLPFAPSRRWGASGSHADSDGMYRGAIDFAPLSSSDKRVLSIAAGRVYRVSCGTGWFLGIDHGGGWMSEYYHLTSAKSSLIGTWVEAGTHLGDAGQTLPCGGTRGSSDHVHLSILNTTTTVPEGKRQYIPVDGIQLDRFTLDDTGGAYNGVWRDLTGRGVLTSRGVTCCLTAASRIGPTSPATSLPDTDGDGIDDYAQAVPGDTDVNGDGRADIVGFGTHGVAVARSTGAAFGAAVSAVSGFGAGSGWQRSRHPRLVIDITGDGNPDIVGFASAGVEVSTGTGNGFAPARRWVGGFGADDGWAVGRHTRTLADVTGDGRADIVGFAEHGVYVARNTGATFAAATRWTRDLGSASGSGGWTAARHPRFVLDVTGDGRPDLVGFGADGVYVARNTGSGFAALQKWSGSFGESAGWRVTQHPRHVADVNGDGRPDLVGFANGGVSVALNRGGSFASPTRWTTSFGNAAGHGGWRGDRHPRTLADVTGDGLPDVVGFGSGGTYVAVNTGTSFGTGRLWTRGFGSTEWTLGWMPRSLADVDGDGRADIVGFASDGVHVALSDGVRFGAAAHGSDRFGWGSWAGTWRVALHPRAVAG